MTAIFIHYMRHTTRLYLLLILLGLPMLSAAKDNLKVLSDSLNATLEQKQYFVSLKKEQIKKIKQTLNDPNLSIRQEYETNAALYEKYQKFNTDSAARYISRNIEIAIALGLDYEEYDSCLKLSMLYSMCGKYREAEEILKRLQKTSLPPDLKAAYYTAYYRFWEYYTISTGNSPYHRQQGRLYRDSMLAAQPPTSLAYKIEQGFSQMETDPYKAEKALLNLLATQTTGTPEYAMVTCGIAYAYKRQGNKREEKKYFMLSAIADLQNATRETVSLQELAMIAYRENDLDQAFRFSQSAIEDAAASGIHFRALQMHPFYSIINAAYKTEQTKVQGQLTSYLTVVCLLAAALGILVVLTYKQMKKTMRIKEELARSNEKLKDLSLSLSRINEELNGRNRQLQEISTIKERYIAQFFDLCSNYIDKMSKYQNEIYKLAINRHYDTLIKRTKSTTVIDKELDSLYEHFDSIFLSLYPTFVADFNALLKEDEQICLKPGTLMNKELRIYALLRLGINDSAKIASFLRCSISTIYNCRTKLRNKANCQRHEFEHKVQQIGNSGQ